MESSVTFRGGRIMVMAPLAVFLAVAVYLFFVVHAFDLMALALGGMAGLFAGALLCKNQDAYWNAVLRGASSLLTGTVIIILLAAGLFSAMMKSGGIAGGFIWLGLETGISGAAFTAFVLLASAIIATATGSSIGTIFTAVPIFFPAGVALGGDPVFLAGAILSGAIFGDNLAPVSDVTVISASTQTYARREGVAEVSGVVASRLPYALAALALSLPVYLLFGGSAASGSAAVSGNPRGLLMLIPVAVLIFVAIRTRNVLSAAMSGIITGVLTGLIFGLFTPEAVFTVKDGNVSGFLYQGVNSMAGVILLCVTLFGVTGVVEQSGALALLTGFLSRHQLSNSPRGAELVMAGGALLSSVAFASVTSAALILFGPMGDRIGREQNLHPYRRSHIMSGMVNSLPVILPFSVFVLIVLGATSSQSGGESVTPFSLMYGAVYPIALFAVFLVSILTGAGRRFEGPNGEPVRENRNVRPVADTEATHD